jgi:hypothetical protein
MKALRVDVCLLRRFQGRRLRGPNGPGWGNRLPCLCFDKAVKATMTDLDRAQQQRGDIESNCSNVCPVGLRMSPYPKAFHSPWFQIAERACTAEVSNG